MKKNKSNQKSGSSASEQIGKTASVAGSKSPKVTADEDIQRAIQVLNEKGYEAENCLGKDSSTGIPFINFSSFVSKKSFTRLPKDLKSFEYHGQLILSFDIDNLAEASTNLLTWAKELPKAVSVMFEINVPKETDPLMFATVVAYELHVYNAEIEYDEEYCDSLLCSLYLAPKRVKPFSRELTAFAKTNGIKIWCGDAKYD